MDMTTQDINEMIFLALNRCRLLSIDEFVIYDYAFKKRIADITPEERIAITKLREKMTKLLREWDITV